MMPGSISFRRPILFVTLSLFTGLCLAMNPLAAQTLESLQQAGKLRIQTRVEPNENTVAMQQLELQIEVATDKWFSGGTRIGRFEIKDAIVLQREKFAVNSTYVEAGTTWTMQTWVLTLYPQRAGRFEVPRIPLTLSIAGEGLEKIQGQLSTKPVEFSATVPDELQDKSSWVASPVFSVKESFNRSLAHFNPGDALIRTIKFSAEDTPAMMLPTLNSINIDGVGIYHKPPELSDKVNRGDYLAERTERLTYVFEQPGEYELPEETFYWWNLKKQQLEEIVLPAHQFKVGAIAARTDSSGPVKEEIEVAAVERVDKWFIIALLLVLLVVIFYLYKLARKQRPSDEAKPSLSERELQKAFKRACRRGEKAKAIAVLYQYLDHFGGAQFSGEIRPLLSAEAQTPDKKVFDEMMEAVFSDNSSLEPDIRKFANQLVSRLKKPGEAGRKWPAPIELKLN